MTRKKPKTYTTVECMVRDIRRGTHESGVFFLARVIRAVRRERSAEVRRLRREKRYVAVAGANLLGLIDAFEGIEGERIADDPEDEAVLHQSREEIDAALAPRRRKS